MYTKIAGVTFAKHAQEIIPRLSEGELLKLVREPDNPKDKNAIRIEGQGERIGFIPAHVARELAYRIDEGENFECRVSQVTGGGDKIYGCNIQLEEIEGNNNHMEDKMPQDSPLGRILPSSDELDEI